MDAARILIVGNCGSGKSWLATRLSSMLRIPVHDLDRYHWEDNSYARARPAEEAISLTKKAAEQDCWIIEGVYGWMAEQAAPRASFLVWLDIPVGDCLQNLLARGPGEGTPENFNALLNWAADYPTRATSSSYSGHKRIFSHFSADRVRLRSRSAITDFLKRITARTSDGAVCQF